MRTFIPFDPAAAAQTERVDAARNRRRVLVAARRLFAEHGVDNVSMDAVAEAACVGKGTLYRRFGDRAGLVMAMLDDGDRMLQEAILRGPPPLGPGAPPAERLIAFLAALADLLETNTALMLAAGPRYRSRLYSAYHLHVAVLLGEVFPEADVRFLADAMLAPLSADLYRHLREDRGLSVEQVKDGLRDLVRLVVAPREADRAGRGGRYPLSGVGERG
jgi:AcrR family transcriptional regulator